MNTYAAMTDNMTSGTPAALWGGNIDMSSMPAWSHSLIAENVLFTRNVIAMNPEIMKEDGTVDLSSVQNTPLMYPTDVQDAVQNAGVSTTSSGSSASSGVAGTASTSAAGTTSTGAAAAASTPTAKSSGTRSTGPKALAILAVGLATVLVL